jgi:hypothetical protein
LAIGPLGQHVANLVVVFSIDDSFVNVPIVLGVLLLTMIAFVQVSRLNRRGLVMHLPIVKGPVPMATLMTGQHVTGAVVEVLNGEDNIAYAIMYPLLTLLVSMLVPLKCKLLSVTTILAVLLPRLRK